MQPGIDEQTDKAAGSWRLRWFWRGLALLSVSVLALLVTGLPEFGARVTAAKPQVTEEASNAPPPAAMPPHPAEAPPGVIIKRPMLAPPPPPPNLAPHQARPLPGLELGAAAPAAPAASATLLLATKWIASATGLVGALTSLVAVLAALLHQVTNLRKEWAGVAKG